MDIDGSVCGNVLNQVADRLIYPIDDQTSAIAYDAVQAHTMNVIYVPVNRAARIFQSHLTLEML